MFQDKVVVVTGGAWGIGKNIAAAFARSGARVVISNRSPEHWKEAEKWFRAQKLTIERMAHDLSEKGAAALLIKDVVSRYGQIDVLINNAKFMQKVQFLEETEESWQHGIGVSLKAAYFATQEAILEMKKRKGGSIVMISSVEGFLAGYDSVVYHIAKAGLIHMTKYLALHAGKYNIRVNCIAPGLIIKDERQERYDQKDNHAYRKKVDFVHPLGRPGRSDDIAKAALFLAGPDAAFITGTCLTVDGGSSVQEQNGLIHTYTS